MTAAHPADQVTTLHQAARWYANNGVHIFPCIPRDKRPLTPNGFHDATVDIELIDTWWNANPDANIGIPLGINGMFVLDIDGPAGAATLTELEELYQPLPDTYRVATGRAEGSGRHHVYRQPDGEPIRNRKIGDHLETRGDGGYVIAPPSIHPSGRPYLAEGHWDQICDAPGWLIHLSRNPTPTTTTSTSFPTTTGNTVAQKRLEACAGRVAIAPDGERNNTLNWAAYTIGRIVAAGHLDPQTAGNTLLSAAGRAGLDQNEAVTTIQSGFAAGAKDPDPTSGQTSSDPTTVTVLDGTPTVTLAADNDDWADQIRAEARTGTDFLHATRGPIPAIWGDSDQVAWAEGEGLLVAGGPGIGKTTVVQQVVTGLLGHPTHQEVLGMRIHGPRNVLYLALDRPRQIGRALGRLMDPAHDSLPLGRLTVWDKPMPFRPDHDRDGLRLMGQALDANIIVIDSLYDLSPGIVKPEVAGEVVACIKTCVNAGIDVVAIHHARKQPTQGRNAPSLDELYGGMQLGAGFGSVLWLKGRAGDLEVSMLHLKQPGDTIGPLNIVHDHQAGISTVKQGADLLAVAIQRGSIDVPTAAAILADGEDPSRAVKERARRRLEALDKAGKLVVVQAGDGMLKVWEPAGQPVTTLTTEA